MTDIIGSMVECLGREFGAKGAVVFIAPAYLLPSHPRFQWNLGEGIQLEESGHSMIRI